MPRNKKEGIIFGVTMCFFMVCGMSAYNLTLVGKLSFAKFTVGLIPGFIVDFFFDTVIVGPVAKKLAFKLPIDRDNKLQTILAISLLMITGMVTFMSVFGPRITRKYYTCIFYSLGNELYSCFATTIITCRSDFTIETANVAKIF